MALSNFTLPFGGIQTHHWATTVSPLQPYHASAVNNLLYGPAEHQESDDPPEYYKNNPYAPPQNHHQYNSRPRTNNNNYLPPLPSPSHRHNSQQEQQQLGYHTRTRTQEQNSQFSHNQQQHTQQQQPQQTPQQQQHPSGNYLPVHQQQHQQPESQRTYSGGETTYNQHVPTRSQTQAQYFNGYNTQTRTYSAPTVTPAPQPTYPPTHVKQTSRNPNVNNYGTGPNRADDISGNSKTGNNINSAGGSGGDINSDDPFPERPPGYTRVQAGQGSRTQVHAVLDYDVEEGEEDYYDDGDQGSRNNDGKKSSMPTVTPIQGPIFLKNGTVPVVPLFSYPTVNNGTFVQIPIWWTALSVALGLDIRGDVIRGVPCIKRYHQLFCPTAGNSYPIEKIEKFIDDNKALMRRMYGDFEMTDFGTPLQQSRRRRRYIDDPDLFIPPGSFPADAFESEPDTEAGETYFGKLRKKRQSINRNKNNQKPIGNNRGAGRGANGPNNNNEGGSGKVDVCESKVEVVTPYWASNSAGKIRAIVNTQHFEQAIHQEMCTKVTTGRCGNDCGCEQKYKWHRLLAYDPDNDCKGIFMDWFLFPSCCVCRCNP